MLQNDLTTAASVSAVLVEGESQAYQAQTPETLRLTVEHRNDRYRISAVITGLALQKVEQTFVVARPDSAGLIAAADALAKEIDPRASLFSTHSDAALKSYTLAAASADPQARMAALQQAIGIDPGFGLAYISALDTASPRGLEAAQNLLREASAHDSEFTQLDQARFAAIRARLTHQPLADQAAAAAALLRTTPNSLDAIVNLASLRFLEGDGGAGKQLLQKGLTLSPGNPALRSYLALGLVETRQFGEAARTYSSLQNDPAVLPQLAVCLLLGGDTRSADSVFDKFAAFRKSAGDPALPIIQGNWLALSGRVADAIALVKGAQFASPDLHSLALSQAAVWEIMNKDIAGAKSDAAAAVRLSASPPVRAIGNAAEAICSGSKSAEELRASVGAAPLREDQKAVVFAYGAFLGGYFDEAAAAWDGLLKQSGGTDLRARAMLASSLRHAGKPAAAGSLPVQPFVPNLAADDQFAAIAFNEMRSLLR